MFYKFTSSTTGKPIIVQESAINTIQYLKNGQALINVREIGNIVLEESEKEVEQLLRE
jgi:hypothetical protein